MSSAGADTPLTEQQLDFVKAYARRSNGTKAAIKAGYAPGGASQQASYLLRLAKVQDALAKEKEKLGIRMDVTLGRWLEELRRIAYSDLKRIADWGEDGVRHIPSEDLDDEDSSTVLSVESKKKIRTTEDGSEETIEMKVKLHDKTRALEMLGRHFGFFDNDKSSNTEIVLTTDQARAILNADFATQKPTELPKVEPL